MPLTSINTRRVGYILGREGWTLSRLSFLTDIPVSTLSYVTRGERELPIKYWTNLRDVYESEATFRLGQVGVPLRSAEALKYYEPEMVLSVQDKFKSITEDLALGTSISTLKGLGYEPTANEVLSIYSQSLDMLRASFRESKMSYEDIDTAYSKKLGLAF